MCAGRRRTILTVQPIQWFDLMTPVRPGSPPETFIANIIWFHLFHVLPPSDAQNLSGVDIMSVFPHLFCLAFHFISSVYYIIVTLALHTGRNSAEQTVSKYRRLTGSGRIIAGRRTEEFV